MYKICFYVPLPHLENVKDAMFAKGAGKIGLYTRCAWQVLGEGQFMPIEGSNPFIGEKNQLEKLAEYKVEMVCNEAHIHDVITALKASHPYEEPAYQIIRCEEL